MKRFLFPILCLLILLFSVNVFAWGEAEVFAVSLNQGEVIDSDIIYPNDDVYVQCESDGWGGGSGSASGYAEYKGNVNYKAEFEVSGNDEDIDWDGGPDYSVYSAEIEAWANASGTSAEAWSYVSVDW